MEKQELKIEDLKAGDELECINPDRYLIDDNFTETKKDILRGEIIVRDFEEGPSGGPTSVIIRSPYCIPKRHLKYFKKKEQSQDTFDDLIDVAVRAWKDNLIGNLFITDTCIDFDAGLETFDYDRKTIKKGIEFIKSLYKETFVIETEDDFNKIKKKARGTLLNGNRFTVEGLTHSSAYGGLLEVHADFTNRKDRLSFLSVKGATMEQSK